MIADEDLTPEEAELRSMFVETCHSDLITIEFLNKCTNASDMLKRMTATTQAIVEIFCALCRQSHEQIPDATLDMVAQGVLDSIKDLPTHYALMILLRLTTTGLFTEYMQQLPVKELTELTELTEPTEPTKH